jgi:DNA mismatch repair ATPase MutS
MEGKNNAGALNWLITVGEFESLNCFANLSFNYRHYCYPELVNEEILEAKSLAHPLIRSEKSVSNDISFRDEKFIVLTGSNMSGKSTFLRTIGVNLVLARQDRLFVQKRSFCFHSICM